MDEVDVIIVGGGLAGLATAYSLGDCGLQVLLLERGDHGGSKNVSGGRLYLEPVRDFFPDLWEDAPFERHVVRESLTLMTPEGSTTLNFRSKEFSEKPYPSFTVLRSTFDQWLAERVTERGAFIVSKNPVDGLVLEKGSVAGIRAGDQEIRSRLVVAADGALSGLGEEGGLQKKVTPKEMAIGIKEVIELPAETIEDRFHLQGGEGAAHLFMGSITRGIPGGGFLYTNRESISIGLVFLLEEAMEEPLQELHPLVDEFKARPEIAPLLRGGKFVEYASHMIPEGGFDALPKFGRDGMLLAGDAAGLVINTGITIRGMDLALVSGALAGRAILETREMDNFSQAAPARYQELMVQSAILKDMETFRHAPKVLRNPRLFTRYPEVLNALFTGLFSVRREGSEKLSKTVRSGLKEMVFRKKGLQDLFQFLKI